MSPVTYCLKLPTSLKIHDVFHVDLLTPYHETSKHGANYTQPPPELIDGEGEYQVEEIIDERTHCYALVHTPILSIIDPSLAPNLLTHTLLTSLSVLHV